MVPVPITSRHSSRLLYIILSAVSNYVPRLVFRSDAAPASLAKRDSEFNPHKASSIVFVVLIPILVLSSGLFAGLTLGYMSLDETQLNVLSISGTPYVVCLYTISKAHRGLQGPAQICQQDHAYPQEWASSACHAASREHDRQRVSARHRGSDPWWRGAERGRIDRAYRYVSLRRLRIGWLLHVSVRELRDLTGKDIGLNP